jgi:hypothetical protein
VADYAVTTSPQLRAVIAGLPEDQRGNIDAVIQAFVGKYGNPDSEAQVTVLRSLARELMANNLYGEPFGGVEDRQGEIDAAMTAVSRLYPHFQGNEVAIRNSIAAGLNSRYAALTANDLAGQVEGVDPETNRLVAAIIQTDGAEAAKSWLVSNQGYSEDFAQAVVDNLNAAIGG